MFIQECWPSACVRSALWEALLDVGRVVLLKAKRNVKQHPQQANMIWLKFDALLIHSSELANRFGESVVWNRQGPDPCIFI